MEDFCEQLRRNDPSVQSCTIDVSQGTQIVQALRANNYVNEILIDVASDYLNRDVVDDTMMSITSWTSTLKNFLKTAKNFKKVSFGKEAHEFSAVKDKLFLDILPYITVNPYVAELVCHIGKIPTEELCAILRMQGLCRLTVILNAELLNSQIVANAFGANCNLESLTLYAMRDLSVAEAVLPRLSENPSLSELVVSRDSFGGPTQGLTLASNTVTFISSLQQMLAASSSLTQLTLSAFVFSQENISVLVSGLKENQSISVLRLRFCRFENDGCSDTFATFMKSINVTNPNLQHLDIIGCEIMGCQNAGPSLPPMLVQAPLRVLEIGSHIRELFRAWVREPDSVQLHGLILREPKWYDVLPLMKSLPNMKSIRELTILELNYPCNRIVRHMQNHWNLRTVVLRREGNDLMTGSEHRLVDAFGMRNTLVPRMLSHPEIPDDDVDDNIDGCYEAKEVRTNQDADGKINLLLFPTLFQTALRTKSKSPHILLLGLLSAGYAIGPAMCDRKRASM